MKRKKIAWKQIVCGVVVLILLGVLLYFINRATVFDNASATGVTAVRARIVEIVDGQLTPLENGAYAGTQTVRAEILSGEEKGRIVEANNTANYFEVIQCEVGTRVVLAISKSGDYENIFVNGYDRTYVLAALCALFALLMILIAGVKGVKALLGLLFTFVTLIGVFIPLLCQGYSPYPVAILWGVVTTLVTVTLVSGFNKKTAATVISTAAGVTVSGLIASLFGVLAHISGYNMQYAEEISLLNTGIQIKIGGLLFAGILISALGAVMDVCMSISSTITELHETNPELSSRMLFKSGMNVGRDMMGTMANTLILAFAGSSLTMLILIYAYKADTDFILSMNDLAIEMIQGLSGSMGIFLSVPIVSAVASAFAKAKPRKKKAQ